tara:strand:+ start:2598 stop:2768 length:171 start_codon:yes stop_codon:yes gene_type:complete
MAVAKKKPKKPTVSKNTKYKITKKNGNVVYRVGLTESEIKRSTEYHKNKVEVVEEA